MELHMQSHRYVAPLAGLESGCRIRDSQPARC